MPVLPLSSSPSSAAYSAASASTSSAYSSASLASSDAYFLKTQQLTVGYDGRPLIENIEVALQKGRVLTLIGPNGAGKSTILKTLSRQLETLSGKVLMAGKELSSYSDKALSRQMSLLLTERLKTERMRCAEVVESGRYPYTNALGILSSDDQAVVRQAMEKVRVLDLAERDFMRVSDGQRQRVLLARAICQEPDIMVLDEPTSYLDIRYQLECLDILRSLAREKHLAILLSLHELSLAQKISDDVLCVKDGAIVYYGPAESTFTRERIRDLYGLDGSFNPHFGNLEVRQPSAAPKLFVIAGAGSGIPLFRRLEKDRIPFASGVLHANDIDAELAQDLAQAVVLECPFRPISEEKLQEAEALMASCPQVTSTLSADDFGPGNEGNRRLLESAKASGRFVSPDIFFHD